MTSLPIMYYALFDWEYNKAFFMNYPLLYKIGMKYTQFGNVIFIKWVFMALWHGCIIYFICLYALENPATYKSNGQQTGLWFAGHTVYGATILVANWEILHKFNIHDGYNLIPIGLMITAYFLFLGILSISGYSYSLSHIFLNMFSQELTWLSLIFCIGYISI